MRLPSLTSSRAPEFPDGLEWTGTSRPLRLSDLHGRLVLLDFWTYGCINCMHVIPRLRQLEERFADVLTVIGVHSGKFAHERATVEIATACDRLGVHHAVVNDRQFRVWRSFDVQAWPTVALIDSRGAIVTVQPGEFDLETMAAQIERLAARDREAGDLTPGPNPVETPAPAAVGGVLRYPTRIEAEGDRIWVSDGGNGRVIEAVLEPGTLRARIVSAWDGLDQPQGLARLAGSTYVAERGGNRVWRLDAGSSREPVAGTGRLGAGRIAEGNALASDLRSPWGLSVLGEQLVVTMAGSHQLFTLDVAEQRMALAAGSGREDVTDGPARQAALAQPQGVEVSGSAAYFADAESSAVRVWDLATNGVRTIVGTGLFDFGDRDGVGDRVRLPHPSDIVLLGEELAVADSYNNRIKLLNPARREARAFPGVAGEAGAFWEPSGLAVAGSDLLVADTNNHRVCFIARSGDVSEIEFVE